MLTRARQASSAKWWLLSKHHLVSSANCSRDVWGFLSISDAMSAILSFLVPPLAMMLCHLFCYCWLKFLYSCSAIANNCWMLVPLRSIYWFSSFFCRLWPLLLFLFINFQYILYHIMFHCWKFLAWISPFSRISRFIIVFFYSTNLRKASDAPMFMITS